MLSIAGPSSRDGAQFRTSHHKWAGDLCRDFNDFCRSSKGQVSVTFYISALVQLIVPTFNVFRLSWIVEPTCYGRAWIGPLYLSIIGGHVL